MGFKKYLNNHAEVGKNERELSSFQFIHERGSYLAHIFTKF